MKKVFGLVLMVLPVVACLFTMSSDTVGSIVGNMWNIIVVYGGYVVGALCFICGMYLFMECIDA